MVDVYTVCTYLIGDDPSAGGAVYTACTYLIGDGPSGGGTVYAVCTYLIGYLVTVPVAEALSTLYAHT